MTVKNKETSDLDRFLCKAPAPMSFALKWIIDNYGGCAEAIKDTLKAVSDVARETDTEAAGGLMLVLAEKVAYLKDALETLDYTRSEIWSVVEEMERFAKAESGSK